MSNYTKIILGAIIGGLVLTVIAMQVKQVQLAANRSAAYDASNPFGSTGAKRATVGGGAYLNNNFITQNPDYLEALSNSNSSIKSLPHISNTAPICIVSEKKTKTYGCDDNNNVVECGEVTYGRGCGTKEGVKVIECSATGGQCIPWAD